MCSSDLGSAELLEGGKCGTLVEVGDVKDLSDGILASLAREPSPERQLKRVQDFDLRATLSAYVNVIREELSAIPDKA